MREPEFLDQFEAAGAGQADVDQDAVEVLQALRDLERLFGAFGGPDPVVASEGFPDGPPHQLLVVDDQEAFPISAGSRGRRIHEGSFHGSRAAVLSMAHAS